MATRTDKLKAIYGWLTFFHMLCLFGPLLIFTIIGFCSASSDNKITLSLTAIVAIILAFISFIVSAKHRANLHRSILWIMVIGIMHCLQSVEVFIWILAITSILDELALSPLRAKYKNKVTINKELDLREV